MNFTLQRHEYRSDGIFGTMVSEDGTITFCTLEHAYSENGGSWLPKVAAGKYACVRHAPNRLPYETFMLANVPDFQGQSVDGILIHILNLDAESEGCIGVGESEVTWPTGAKAIAHSADAFKRFMDLQQGVQAFSLTILA